MKSRERKAQHSRWLDWNADLIYPFHSYDAQTSNHLSVSTANSIIFVLCFAKIIGSTTQMWIGWDRRIVGPSAGRASRVICTAAANLIWHCGPRLITWCR